MTRATMILLVLADGRCSRTGVWSGDGAGGSSQKQAPFEIYGNRYLGFVTVVERG